MKILIYFAFFALILTSCQKEEIAPVGDMAAWSFFEENVIGKDFEKFHVGENDISFTKEDGEKVELEIGTIVASFEGGKEIAEIFCGGYYVKMLNMNSVHRQVTFLARKGDETLVLYIGHY
jgi:hypothetical protein